MSGWWIAACVVGPAGLICYAAERFWEWWSQ
jgi:hypothetical protein